MTPGQKVAQVAQRYAGVEENPLGSNRGKPYPEAWQKPWGMGTGWPWCGAYAKAMYVEADVDDDNIGHPSTAAMYERAKARPGSIVSKAIPGAYILWPGTHVGIVVRDLGNNVALCIEGNSGDGVRYRNRAYGPGTGAMIVAPKAVRLGHKPVAPVRDYYLGDDKATPRVIGPWSTRAKREKALAKIKSHVRKFRRGGKFYAEIGTPKVYGPWESKAQRNAARVTLEDRLGRSLRPFSRPAKGAAADDIGKTT
jgi:hypothetical protein